MSPYDYGQFVVRLYEFFKMANSRAGRITDDKACCQMDHFSSIYFHLFRDILYVPSWTPSTIGESHNFDRFVLRIKRKTPGSFSNGSKTLATATVLVTAAEDDSFTEFQNMIIFFLLGFILLRFILTLLLRKLFIQQISYKHRSKSKKSSS